MSGSGDVVNPEVFHSIRTRNEVTAANVYLVGSLALSPTMDLTARLGYANVDIAKNKEDVLEDEIGTEGMTPGSEWSGGLSSSVRLRAAGGRTSSGRLSRIRPTADPARRLQRAVRRPGRDPRRLARPRCRRAGE